MGFVFQEEGGEEYTNATPFHDPEIFNCDSNLGIYLHRSFDRSLAYPSLHLSDPEQSSTFFDFRVYADTYLNEVYMLFYSSIGSSFEIDTTIKLR